MLSTNAGHPVPRRGRREHAGQQGRHHVLVRPLGEVEGQLEPLRDLLGRQRTGPAGVPADQDQCRWSGWVPAVELQSQRAAEGQPADHGPVQSECGREVGEAVGEVGHPERLGRRVRTACAGRVPDHHRELVGQGVELGAPAGPSVADETLEQQQRRSVARPRVCDPQALDLDGVHRVTLWPDGLPSI